MDFQAIAGVVGDSLQCNICILDKDGHIMGYYLSPSFSCPVLEKTKFLATIESHLRKTMTPSWLTLTPPRTLCAKKPSKQFREDLDFACSDMAIHYLLKAGDMTCTLHIGRCHQELKTSDLF